MSRPVPFLEIVENGDIVIKTVLTKDACDKLPFATGAVSIVGIAVQIDAKRQTHRLASLVIALELRIEMTHAVTDANDYGIYIRSCNFAPINITFPMRDIDYLKGLTQKSISISIDKRTRAF